MVWTGPRALKKKGPRSYMGPRARLSACEKRSALLESKRGEGRFTLGNLMAPRTLNRATKAAAFALITGTCGLPQPRVSNTGMSCGRVFDCSPAILGEGLVYFATGRK